MIKNKKMNKLEKKLDCYWYPIVRAFNKSYQEYRRTNGNNSEYNCIKCSYKQQTKCPAYINYEEMNSKNVDILKSEL